MRGCSNSRIVPDQPAQHLLDVSDVWRQAADHDIGLVHSCAREQDVVRSDPRAAWIECLARTRAGERARANLASESVGSALGLGKGLSSTHPLRSLYEKAAAPFWRGQPLGVCIRLLGRAGRLLDREPCPFDPNKLVDHQRRTGRGAHGVGPLLDVDDPIILAKTAKRVRE